MKRLCPLDSYLNFYDRSWQRIRKARRAAHQYNGKDDRSNMKVYSSYEVLFQDLENTHATAAQDAVELLKIFSFMSNEEIRFDSLTAAVRHPRLQEKHDMQEKQEREAVERDPKKRSLKHRPSMRRPSIQLMKEWIIWAVGEIQTDRSRPGKSLRRIFPSTRWRYDTCKWLRGPIAVDRLYIFCYGNWF